MKNKASIFLKQVMSTLMSSTVKAKNKKLITNYSIPNNNKNKLNGVVEEEEESSKNNKAVVLYMEACDDHDCDDDERSVIELVRNSKKVEGEDFNLENEIDDVADMYIRRFHKQIRLQKLESFKRYQEMLQRSIS